MHRKFYFVINSNHAKYKNEIHTNKRYKLKKSKQNEKKNQSIIMMNNRRRRRKNNTKLLCEMIIWQIEKEIKL